ncbi:MAG: hypothetical protein ABI867_12040 [Kofleriaceae bacterium]
MPIEPGHNSGPSDVPPGTTWADLIAELVAATGTLTAVAWRLVEHADGDDVASVERALRRLRTRGQRDGGVWGQRLLRVFGVPLAIEDRVRWMGLYHSPFNDLPVALCVDQLRLWDRPPVSASRARIWVHLGYASAALRTRRFADASVHVARATEALASAPAEYDTGRIEVALVEGYVASREDHAATAAPLARAAEILARATLTTADRACFAARLVDHHAYHLNHTDRPAEALALYETLPAADTHPFASYRRDAGLAYGYHRAGRTAEAIALATRAIEHAGDGGYTRLRAMGLIVLATIDPASATRSLDRAAAIAARLGDDELASRVARRR